MKPFNLEEAKAGKKVVTRNGRPVRIVEYNRKTISMEKLIGIVDFGEVEKVYYFLENGNSGLPMINSELDLFMAIINKKGWVNLYSVPPSVTESRRSCGDVYLDKDTAVSIGRTTAGYIATVGVDWEE